MDARTATVGLSEVGQAVADGEQAAPVRAQRAAALLGRDPRVRKQVMSCLVSAVTYVLYAAIVGLQIAWGIVPPAAGSALIAVTLGLNLVFYGLVRSGAVAEGLDPGLSRTQMGVGILAMYLAYAVQGPTAPAVLVVMASHVVYAMFVLSPRAVWRLVAVSLLGLAATQAACVLLWPERYPVRVQVVGFLYAALVLPLIALLADRVTAMTQRLKAQQAALQEALTQVRELATRDELTRTHNRHHMIELLRLQQEQRRRADAPVAVALIDIDHFKLVNDRYGHATGDEVLRRLAVHMKAQLRAGDQLARWGGEEFLLLLPATTPEDGLQVLERMQRSLAEAGPALMPLGLAISYSGGVTHLGRDESIDAAIDRADQAMYRAKQAGRARSTLA